MNRTVMQLTARSLLGRKRIFLLLGLSLILLGLALIFRATTGTDDEVAVHLVGGFAIGTIVPLICLIAGTGSIGVEIDDGSIVYILSKPVRRSSIIISKLAVAFSCSVVFGALPVLISSLLLVDETSRLIIAYVVGAVVASLVYGALFLLLAVVTRNAAIAGLLYALVWETMVAGFIPGARSLSVREWAGAVVEKIVGSEASRTLDITSDVGFAPAVILLCSVLAVSVWYAIKRLQTIRLASVE